MRFWEIDFFRGLAVVLMVLFNWSFTLKFLNIFTFTDSWIYWWLFPRIIGGAFIFLAGFSIILFYNKINSTKRVAFRGLKIFLMGLGITTITFFTFPENIIWFGILHFIGLSLIFSIIFLKYKKFILLVGSILLIVGFAIQAEKFSFPYLLWLGLEPSGFQTFDYWPILPWFGVFLFGMYFSDFFFRKFGSKKYTRTLIIKQICFLGRNSLTVYIVHQPILIFILYILGLKIF